MMTSRFFSACLLVLTLLATAPSPAAAETADGPAQVVMSAVNDVMAQFGGKHLSQDECVAGLSALIDRYADLAMTTGRILGYHWGKADDSQKNDLINLVRNYLIGSWAGHLNDVPNDQHIDIVGTEDGDDNRSVVHSVLLTADGNVPVDWTTDLEAGGRWVITDIKVDGVSMVQTLHGDFTAVIRANDGKIQPLIDALRSKIKSY